MILASKSILNPYETQLEMNFVNVLNEESAQTLMNVFFPIQIYESNISNFHEEKRSFYFRILDLVHFPYVVTQTTEFNLLKASATE